MLPVKNVRPPPMPDDWRFVEDLRAVNAAVQPRAPNVPNPNTILSQIPSDSTCFTVVDLSNASFSVPVHPDSQLWFAFQFEGKGYTFTCLPQDYSLWDSLSDHQLPEGSALLQYVDDLLIAAPSDEKCRTDSVCLLKHLAARGHKASLKKLQYCQPSVTFLGHILSANSRAIAPKRSAAITSVLKPQTKKQLLSFLGLCEKLLRDIITGSMNMAAELTWTPDAEDTFVDLKGALQSGSALGIPDPLRPFTQAEAECDRRMTSVLLQEHGGQQRPVAYFSSRLDTVAAGFPRCLRAVAAAERALVASRDVVGYAP